MMRALVWVATGALVLAAVVVSGAVPIGASSGHWAATSWVLDFVKRRSVATRALGVDAAPALDAPALVLAGAAHYERGCSPCHGRPGLRPPVAPARMTPPPPDLQRQAGRWSAAGLFYVVKHGIKFTGMPAWPARDRDDEVWAVVAFVRRLPSMTADGYDRLVFADGGRAAAADVVASSGPSSGAASATARLAATACARCHGVEGRGRAEPGFPRLAGQQRAYLRESLRAYADGARHSGIMSPVAASLSEQQTDDLAAYFAGLPPVPSLHSSPGSSAAELRQGADIAARGVPDEGVPACLQCHAPRGDDRHPGYPILAGQPRHYLERQLQLLSEGRRGGTSYAHIMRQVASGLSATQRSAVSAHFAAPVR